MDNKRLWNAARTWSLLAVGTALYAFGLQYFILPNLLMEGGVTGVAVLLNYAAGIPVSISTRSPRVWHLGAPHSETPLLRRQRTTKDVNFRAVLVD